MENSYPSNVDEVIEDSHMRGMTEEMQKDVLAAYARILERENKELRKIFPDILNALGNGASCSEKCSVEFFKDIPGEIRLEVEELKKEASRYPKKKCELYGKMKNETYESRARLFYGDKIVDDAGGPDITIQSLFAVLNKLSNEDHEGLKDFITKRMYSNPADDEIIIEKDNNE